MPRNNTDCSCPRMKNCIMGRVSSQEKPGGEEMALLDLASPLGRGIGFGGGLS